MGANCSWAATPWKPTATVCVRCYWMCASVRTANWRALQEVGSVGKAHRSRSCVFGGDYIGFCPHPHAKDHSCFLKWFSNPKPQRTSADVEAPILPIGTRSIIAPTLRRQENNPPRLYFTEDLRLSFLHQHLKGRTDHSRRIPKAGVVPNFRRTTAPCIIR